MIAIRIFWHRLGFFNELTCDVAKKLSLPHDDQRGVRAFARCAPLIACSLGRAGRGVRGDQRALLPSEASGAEKTDPKQ